MLLGRVQERVPIVTGENYKCVGLEMQRLSDQLVQLDLQETNTSQIHNFDSARSAGNVHYLLQRLRPCEARMIKHSLRRGLTHQRYATAWALRRNFLHVGPIVPGVSCI